MNRLSESFNPLAQLRGSGGAPVEGNIRSGKKRGGVVAITFRKTEQWPPSRPEHREPPTGYGAKESPEPYSSLSPPGFPFLRGDERWATSDIV